MLTIDHVVISVGADLDQAVLDYRELGFNVIYGGVHANNATHNALICFEDGTYIELMALTGHPPKDGMIDFSVLLREHEGLVGYALLCADIEAEVERQRANGVHVSEIMAGERLRKDGARVAWKTATLDGNFTPFLIQDVTPHNIRVPDDAQTVTHANGVRGINAVNFPHNIEVRVNNADTIGQLNQNTTQTHGLVFA